MTPPDVEDNLLGPIEDVQLPVDVPNLYRGPSIDLRFTCKSQQEREPTSGLESLTSSHYECAARHLGATEGLTSRTAALSALTQARKPP